VPPPEPTEPPERRRSVGFEWAGRLADQLPGGGVVNAWLDGVDRLVDQVPAAAWVRSRVDEVERAALERLAERLEEMVPKPSPDPAPAGGDGPTSAAQHVAALLRAAEDQSPAEARAAARLRVALDLVPDEAKILRTLADGSEHAVIQAHDGAVPLVVNHSAVGRAARVHSRDLTATYVTHLLDLGLVELAPHEGTDLMEFELLESETAVRDVLAPYDHRKLRKPRITRQVVRLSAAGRAFCEDVLGPA
jgi:hypothetical protein